MVGVLRVSNGVWWVCLDRCAVRYFVHQVCLEAGHEKRDDIFDVTSVCGVCGGCGYVPNSTVI